MAGLTSFVTPDGFAGVAVRRPVQIEDHHAWRLSKRLNLAWTQGSDPGCNLLHRNIASQTERRR
ncbi:hypothetical protein [Siccirubricoccus deserti]|uniref:Uncharacterized protein n=1 Tax=Siccirubricoccus deserti TaxID=2013562 RepID=A0A9X0R1W6_9PROT|nr:hypothetical protein [Siccirubricoccus deserti]MBC4017242.1 hypothetical protein [Siccirubricoccus deserti]